MLQAKIDLNVNRQNVIAQQSVILTAKRALNQLLAFQSDYMDYNVADSISSLYNIDKEQLQKQMEEQNATLLALQKQLNIASLTVKEFNTQYFPKLSVNAGYFLSQTNSDAGNTILNRAIGPQLGVNLSIPLFQAGNVRRQVSTARIQMQSIDWQIQNQKVLLRNQLINALADFDNQKAIA